MKRVTHWQLAAAGGFLVIYTILSLTQKPSYGLSALSDISGAVLWALAVAAMLWAAFSNSGRARWFWILFAGGAALGLCNFSAWVYYDVIKHVPPPEPLWADIPLFLQAVPMMAGAALRPGLRQRPQKFYLGTLSFLTLLLVWVYIFAFFIYPNEYILGDTKNLYYLVLYLIEYVVLLAVMGGVALSFQGAWRQIYWQLFLAGALYLVTFEVLNAALDGGGYYGGSFYDVPYYAAFIWFIVIALNARKVPSEELSDSGSERGTDLPGILAALAVLSLPVAGLSVLVTDPPGSKLRAFRISVTLAAILLVGICVFLRQLLLSREMKRLLLESTENLEQLQRAQSQLIQKERLAGVGQLVAGVAHELNNPLTAVMGYSDLLVDQAGDTGARQKLEKLGTEARRMKRIIDNLLNFAKPQHEGRRMLDVSVVVRESVMLCEYQLRNSKIQVEIDFAPNIPRVPINEGQFKQVFVNLLSNSTNALERAPEKKIRVEGYMEGDRLVMRFSDSGPGFTDLNRVFDPFYTTRPVGQGTGLGLSTCYGTVREHKGNIYVHNLQPHGAAVTIELPVEVAQPAPAAVLQN